MKHDIDKQSMMNDIILTIALILSLSIVTVISHIIDLYNHTYRFETFIILVFFLTKIFYNAINHICKNKK